MYKRIGVTAALPAAGWISVAGRDRAASTDVVLQRACKAPLAPKHH
jgi:hypothetical protein